MKWNTRVVLQGNKPSFDRFVVFEADKETVPEFLDYLFESNPNSIDKDLILKFREGVRDAVDSSSDISPKIYLRVSAFNSRKGYGSDMTIYEEYSLIVRKDGMRAPRIVAIVD